MKARVGGPSNTQDWRLEAELDDTDGSRALDDLIGRLRGHSLVEEVEAAVGDEVVVTHDGKLLFAYAQTESSLQTARGAIESILAHDQITASVRVSHWDQQHDLWLQTDPPSTQQEARQHDNANRRADVIETRTMVATSGCLVRAEFERSMMGYADELGLRYEVFEHPHLLTTQVGFTVTGPKHKIDEFTQGMRAEGWASVRAEMNVAMSPL